MEKLTEYIAMLPSWLVVSLTLVISFGLLMIIRQIIFSLVGRVIEKTTFQLDSIFIQAMRTPSLLLVMALLAMEVEYLLTYFEVNHLALTPILMMSSKILLIFSIVLFIDSICIKSISQYSKSNEFLKNSSSLAHGFTRIFIIGVGVLVILGTLGISITPIVASLGITSLAVALALQPTLQNFFSGVQLIADKPIRIGDYIELESGEQGFVEKIGWRSTWIRMLPNNIVIMPNSILSQSKIINYYYPEKELSVPVEVGVHYDSDLDFVEKVTLEVAREILKSHKWGVESYETFIVYHTFDSSSINFTVMLRAEEYFNRFFIKSEFIKSLHKRYRKEGIVIPYPIRAINTAQESSK